MNNPSNCIIRRTLREGFNSPVNERSNSGYARDGKMPCREMQKFSARYGCKLLCGWLPPDGKRLPAALKASPQGPLSPEPEAKVLTCAAGVTLLTVLLLALAA